MATAAGTETFYGLATPPTSYGGYGGRSQNAKDDGEAGACAATVAGAGTQTTTTTAAAPS